MPHVLVVEDSDDFRDALCEWLFEAGLDAVAVSTAAEAKDFLTRNGMACLVVLDLHLPDESGETVVKWVRADARHRDNPIVVLTATSITNVPGSNALLSKPVNFDALLAVINHYIARLAN
jgi:CheY-like chemotaxis protein